ncbi:tyrosine-type recombinase/integrase [Dorea longicatena]|uniref:tyrosine-type recombinase/integrase n=1 Tax=Dorea longicatena TaxID=88431 RepID=UPI00237A5BB8|nr:tyrosine-type recombinase/integrase [Dorea longicatena]
MEWYFVVWYLAATGARVSELIQIKIEHIEIGYFDLYTKGGKLRRLYIPQKLKKETLEWLKEKHRSSGYLFLNRYGERITTRGISQQLKNYAEKYGLDKKVVYPHSFRHRYAKNFLEKYNDSHSNIYSLARCNREIPRVQNEVLCGGCISLSNAEGCIGTSLAPCL